MQFGKAIPDKALLTAVHRKLAQKCSGSTKINTTVSGGEATVTGTIKSEHERNPIIRCISTVPGIRRVVEHLKVEERKRVT